MCIAVYLQIAFPFFKPVNTQHKNIVLRIDNDKYSIQEFGLYIQKYTPSDQVIDDNYVKQMLSSFVGEKLLEKEIEYHNIKILY